MAQRNAHLCPFFEMGGNKGYVKIVARHGRDGENRIMLKKAVSWTCYLFLAVHINRSVAHK